MKDVMELIPVSERPKFTRAIIKQDNLDTLQLLSDLGYLGPETFDDEKITTNQLKISIAQFRAECRLALNDIQCTNFSKLCKVAAFTSEIVPDNKLSQQELLLLKYLTGLEGELEFKSLPNELDVCHRVAFYRFRVYSLIRVYPRADKLNQQVKLLSSILKQYKFDGTLPDFLNILGDQHKLSEFCKSSRFSQEGFIGPIFFFRVKDRKAKEFNKLTGEKIKQKKKDFLEGIRVPKLKTTLNKVLSKVPVDQINLYIDSNQNKFILRVLQVKLWVMGLYQGKLDHDFGPLSLKALKQLLEIIFENSEEGEADLKNILYIINQYQCVINFQYLLERHIIQIEKNNSLDYFGNYYSIIAGDYQHHDNSKVRAEANKLEQHVKEALVNHTHKLIELKCPRRMYKGRNGFRKFISSMVAEFKNSAKKIIAFIKKLKNIISKSIKFIFEEIKEAILTLKRGLAFLFGKRKIKINNHIFSDYDFDFDGHTVLLSTVTTTHVSHHTNEITMRAEALYPTIQFVVEVVRWGVNSATGLAWLQILVRMAQLLKKLISNNRINN